MFYTSLVISLLLVGILYYRRKNKDFVATSAATCFGFLVAGMFIFGTLIMAVASVLCVIAICWHERTGRSGFVLLVCCLLATAAIYSSYSWHVLNEVSTMQRHFVEASIEDRAPVTKAEYAARGINDQMRGRWSTLKTRIDDRVGGHTLASRVTPELIERLHNDTLSEFINSPAFGNPRMQINPNRFVQRIYHEQKREPVPFADSSDEPPLSAASTQPGEPYEITDTLDGLHTRGVLDFVNPLGFGLFQDRKRVIGFGSHGFSRTPEASGWQIRTVELVGLMKHEQPVVYVSKNLPRMDELVKAPTRPLDALEAHGLAKLVAGDDYYATDTPDGLRMVGAIRSVEQCQKCHGGGQGDLLGAFSYRLAPAR